MGPTGVPAVPGIDPAARHPGPASRIASEQCRLRAPAPVLGKVSSLPKRQAKRTALSFLWTLGSGSSWRVCGRWRKALSRRPGPSARRSGTIDCGSTNHWSNVHSGAFGTSHGEPASLHRLWPPRSGCSGSSTSFAKSRAAAGAGSSATSGPGCLAGRHGRPSRVSSGDDGCLSVGPVDAESPGERLDWEQRAGGRSSSCLCGEEPALDPESVTPSGRRPSGRRRSPTRAGTGQRIARTIIRRDARVSGVPSCPNPSTR